jgi:crotonobetainyl-CoA:carnitine CoA-transferase CaiB-like acyl-CoA transferase
MPLQSDVRKTATTVPLKGIRVLDLTNVLAGPFCCHQLAHFGADVVKIEVPGSGDLARQLGADAELNRKLMGVSFLAQNSGKRSMTLNLKSVKGKAIFRQMVETADVVVENFRPGVMDRLDLGFETLKCINPKLVYCAISGFGQDGPLNDLPAYDQIIQGMSGVMSITGHQQTAPCRVGYPVADTIGGMTAAFAVAAALAPGEMRSATFIDVSMLEATLASMGWIVSNYLIAGKTPEPMGNDNFSASPSGTFITGDGPINIAANKQEQFESLCRVVGKENIATDPRFAKRRDRLQRRSELNGILEDALKVRPAAEWVDLLSAAGVPAGLVNSVPEVLAQPQIADRGMLGTFSNVPGVDRDIQLVRTGTKVNGTAPAVDTPPPQLGQHTDALLAELGLSLAEIEELKRENVV